ncbi:MAG: hypothetical protein ACYC4Q_02145 [Victivallaceae bacterium]
MDLDAFTVIGIIHIAFGAAAHDQVSGVGGGLGLAGSDIYGDHAACVNDLRVFDQRREVEPGAFPGIAIFCEFRHFLTSIF